MRFLDVYMPSKVAGTPWVSSPRFSTTIQVDSGGNERSNQNWEHPLMRFVAPEAIARDWKVVEGLMKHWRITRGPHRTFPARDPMDFASCDLDRPNQLPTPTMLDQALGTGDGFTTAFPITKTYAIEDVAETYTRNIWLPVLASVLVADNGVLVDPANYSVTRPGGIVTFDVAPLAGHALTCGYLFDVNVRFESDDALEQILRAHRAAGFADLTLLEVRPC
jgi:uncharacterized protein (TIGR02217 family)